MTHLDARPFERLTARLPLLILVLLAAALVAMACDSEAESQGERSPVRLEPHPDGDADIGRGLVESYGCATCHVIPGVGEDSHVGPPLTNFALREFIAGRIPNGAENLVLWILDPQSIDPETAMPNVGASLEEAQHMASFLATLD